ncbi:MAG TPA: LapA family protein [Aquella sp.]|nr:LapA family protein [Aquella sp.]
MKLLKILSWILRIALFIIILVLVLDNMQTIDFNLFSIYHIKLPLIALLLIFFVIGVLLGLLFGILRGFASKSDVRRLEKEIASLRAARQTN